MMTRRTAMELFATSAVTLALGACDSTKYRRYKMSIEVETPEGVKTGFAVREMGLSNNSVMRPAVGQLRGEAVAVDLIGGQTLFALLTGTHGDVDYAMQIGGRAEVWGKSPGEPNKGPVELYPKAPDTIGLKRSDPLPMLVRFRDISDPTSVERVDPDDLASSFGPGVWLKRITIEVTDDPVTTGIERRLGWLTQPLKGYDFRPEGIPVGNFRGLFTTEMFE